MVRKQSFRTQKRPDFIGDIFSANAVKRVALFFRQNDGKTLTRQQDGIEQTRQSASDDVNVFHQMKSDKSTILFATSTGKIGSAIPPAHG